MTEKKTIFIIPGFRHVPTNKAYTEIVKMLKKEGYSPIVVTIPWKHSTISQNTAFFLKKYKKIQTKEKYILGFSFGAMIAFLASTKVAVDGLILCSLSPYFKEDVLKMNKDVHASLTMERYADFSTLHSGRLTKQLKAKQVLLLYGQKEAKSLINRVNETYDQIPSTHKYLMPIWETEHNIGDKRYLEKIHQIARQLN